MSFLDLDVGINREGGNISGTSVELVKIRLKKGTRKTRSDNDHFMKLIHLINKCVGWTLKRSELEEIRIGFQDWVEEYEEYVSFSNFALAPHTHPHKGSFIRRTHHKSQPARSPYTASFTLQMALQRLAQCGLRGCS